MRLPPCLTCSCCWSQFLLTEEFLLLPSNSTSPSAIGIHTKSPIPLIHSLDLPPDILCARNPDFLLRAGRALNSPSRARPGPWSMERLLLRPSLLVLIVAAIALSSVPAVRSETGFSSSAIRLPSENDESKDLCYWSAQPASCPVKCFRTDPVCGVDGVTYWCGCADAACAGVRVASLGFCEVGNGGSGPVSGQALLLVHIVWLIVLGFSVLFGIF